ncbi:hypothetical protein HYDPIDRAFT_31827 [Hydnomerulius pinastri MD-312]|uniref:Uncharacterized protein n=1 Tax=Hydnomerulius pinastri MD-312 TaxID=994086 RepID=A0A0C9WBM7_9AGAM|nr:hypothetical protein HYDPIDRAFT_31827 [Hydnomerulius pinastri MD-312]
MPTHRSQSLQAVLFSGTSADGGLEVRQDRDTGRENPDSATTSQIRMPALKSAKSHPAFVLNEYSRFADDENMPDDNDNGDKNASTQDPPLTISSQCTCKSTAIVV